MYQCELCLWSYYFRVVWGNVGVPSLSSIFCWAAVGPIHCFSGIVYFLNGQSNVKEVVVNGYRQGVTNKARQSDKARQGYEIMRVIYSMFLYSADVLLVQVVSVPFWNYEDSYRHTQKSAQSSSTGWSVSAICLLSPWRPAGRDMHSVFITPAVIFLAFLLVGRPKACRMMVWNARQSIIPYGHSSRQLGYSACG